MISSKGTNIWKGVIIEIERWEVTVTETVHEKMDQPLPRSWFVLGGLRGGEAGDGGEEIWLGPLIHYFAFRVFAHTCCMTYHITIFLQK